MQGQSAGICKKLTGRIKDKVNGLLDLEFCEISLFQRDPPGGEAGIAFSLPRQQTAGLLFLGAGDENLQIITVCKGGVAAVTALHDDQRLGRKALFRQVGTRPAGVGTVGDRLPGPGGGEHLGTQALQIHVGARDLLPVCHTAGWGKIEVIGMHRDALGKLPGQLCRQRGFAAAGGADDGKGLPLLQREADVIEDLCVFKMLFQMLYG